MKRKRHERIFCPKYRHILLLLVLMFVFLFFAVATFAIIIYREFIEDERWIYIFCATILLMCFIVPKFFKQLVFLKINEPEKYFKLNDSVIYFSDIANFEYTSTETKPYMFSFNSLDFYFVLKSGEKLKFCTYLELLEKELIGRLRYLGFSVNHVMSVKKEKNIGEEMFCPTKGYLILWIIAGIISIILSFYLMSVIYDIFDTQVDVELLILLIVYIVILLPLPFFMLQSSVVKIDRTNKYFKIKDKKIPFSAIQHIEYNKGYLKPYKYSMIATVFYFVLTNGNRIRFYAYLPGLNYEVISLLEGLGFKVSHCKTKFL